MKKLFTPPLNYFNLLVIGLLLTTNSCRKDSPSLKQNSQDLLAQAKEAFSDQIAIDQNYQLLSSSSKKSFRHGLAKTPDWKNAVIKTLSKGKAVLVPIDYDKEIFLKTGGTKPTYLSLKHLSYLLIYNNKGKGKTIEWVTFMPEDDSYRIKGNKFTGKVIIEDWAGNFKKGYVFDKEGKIFTLIQGNNDNGGPKIQSNGVKVNDVYCVSTPWYGENISGGESFWYLGGYDTSCYSTGSQYSNDQDVGNPEGGFTGETFPDDYVGTVNNDIVGINSTLFLRMYQVDMIKYPMLTDILSNLDSYVQNNPAILQAISKFSYLSTSDVISNLKFGKGAFVSVSDNMNNDTYGMQSNGTIYLNSKYIGSLENFGNRQKYNAIRMFMIANLLHEFIHWGNYQSYRRYPSIEVGTEFECETFGGTVEYDYQTGEVNIIPCN